MFYFVVALFVACFLCVAVFVFLLFFHFLLKFYITNRLIVKIGKYEKILQNIRKRLNQYY